LRAYQAAAQLKGPVAERRDGFKPIAAAQVNA
jgi:hypothetical protein